MKKRIFLVDDDKNIRSLLTTLLEIEGFEVIKNLELSVDGVFQTVKTEKPDLVLLDVHLKDVDGIEILKAIRSDPSLDQIRVIMSSGMELQRICMDAGANGFLMKPYMPAELLEIIK